MIKAAKSRIAMNLTSKALCVIERNLNRALERHRETFDPGAGLGGVEIWISFKEEDGA
jgi:hypothetical protein